MIPLVAVAGAIGGILLGLLLARMSRRPSKLDLDRVTAELSRSESHGREQARLLGRVHAEQAAVGGLIRQLPDVVRELNRSDLDPGRIPGLLFNLAQGAFQPQQLLLYLVRNPGDTEDVQEELFLKVHHGIADLPTALKRVRVGEGRIGWAAENKVEMLADDWMNLTRTEGRSVPENHPSLRLDMIGPLVHYSDRGPILLGVLCLALADIPHRPRDEKRILQLITGLASIALINARHVSELNAKANHDGLTGLLNKRQLMVDLGTLIHKAERENQPLGVFLLDIDHFKSYNDQNGHMEGDELLKAMARLIRKSLRPGDLAGRYGGEEFLIAMPQTDRDGALTVARRLREAIESYPFPHGEKQPLGKLTISGGVAAFPSDGAQSGDLIRGADLALYEAKRAGRNRVLPHRGIEIGDDCVARDPVATRARPER